MTTERDYFAYGSNLDLADWHRWCAGHGYPEGLLKPIGNAELPDHELVFGHHSGTRNGGTLDVRRCPGAVVRGMLFRVREGGWQALARKEGGKYQRVQTIVLYGGREMPADTFMLGERDRSEFVQPTGDYVEIVRAGREAWDLGDEDLDVLARGERAEPLDAVFVYGTLMRGESRFGALDRAGLRCVLLAERWGRLLDLGAYPGLLLDEAGGALVQGEFVRHADIGALLERLDAIEGFEGFGANDSLYRRTVVDVAVGDGRVRQAWTYVYAGDPGAPTIASGDWRVHRGVRRAFLERLVAAYAAGDEPALARGIVARNPWLAREAEQAVRGLMPLAEALAGDGVSERALAQATDRWVVVP